jgi:hypothetical protein
MSRLPVLSCAWVVALLGVTGCKDMDLDWFKKKPEPEPKPLTARKTDPVLANTIGEKVLLGDAQPVRLRGFGVVIGLGDRGGSDAPTTVREYLVDYLAKEAAAAKSAGRKWPSPQKLLDSPDSAIVTVYGLVPPGAADNTIFDVQVEALGTQTQSLEGGVLLPTELKIWDASIDKSGAVAGLVAGRSLAKARGVIFTNPQPAADRKSGERRGWILGGGRAIEDRGFRLMLEEPSYNTAKRIESRLNERFGQSPKVATAQSQGYVQVHTPPAYEAHPERFIELANHVLLENAPALVERRVQDLVGSIAAAKTEQNSISLIWEGMGRTVLSQIQPLYSHADSSVAFYAARAGLRLKDMSAFPVVATVAADASHPQQLAAIRELGQCGLVQAGAKLIPLLNGDDQETRIAAYEALLNLRHPAVRTTRFPHTMDSTQANVFVDVVSTTGKPLIYVRRTREPRIAIFGPKMPIKLPLFYTHPQDWVTINAKDAAGDLTVFCRSRTRNRLSDTLKIPPRVDELVRALAAPPVADDSGTLKGLGLHYSLVIEVLDKLCKQGNIPATLVLEQTSGPDLIGPTPTEERPETDSDAPSSAPAEKSVPTARAETGDKPSKPKPPPGREREE